MDSDHSVRHSSESGAHIAETVRDTAWAGKDFAYLDGNTIARASKDGLDDKLSKEPWKDANDLIAAPAAGT